MKKVVALSFAVLGSSSVAAFATFGSGTVKPTVPEISAVAGVSAIAVVFAGVALFRERFKR